MMTVDGEQDGKRRLKMESTKLSARVTAYRDAIRAARDAGVTWGQLAALFNADAKYFAAVCKAMDGGRYKAVEQLPLPEAKAAAVKPENAKTAPDSEGPTTQSQKKALPRVGGQSGDREMTAAEKAIADIPHI